MFDEPPLARGRSERKAVGATPALAEWRVFVYYQRFEMSGLVLSLRDQMSHSKWEDYTVRMYQKKDCDAEALQVYTVMVRTKLLSP